MGTENGAAAALAPFAGVAFAGVAFAGAGMPPVLLLALEAAKLFGGVSSLMPLAPLIPRVPLALADLARDGDTFLVAPVPFGMSLDVSLAAEDLGGLLEVVLSTRNLETSLTSSSSSSPSSYTT